jgi:hypothetical protein
MKIFLIVALFVLVGCVAGGVFINHHKPDVYYNTPTEFVLELIVNAGNAGKAYRNANILYQNDNGIFVSQQMTVEESNGTRVVFKVIVPPVCESNMRGQFKYYFEYIMSADGVDYRYYYPEDKNPITIEIKEKRNELTHQPTALTVPK